MRCRSLFVTAVFCLLMCQVSCSRAVKAAPIKDKVPVSPVHGIVSVDGVPTGGVYVSAFPEGTIAESRPQYLKFGSMSAADGKFSFKTYVRGDGLPHGNYILMCRILEQTGSGEKDLLGGQYSDSIKPLLKFEVADQKDIDLGTIELKMPATKTN